MNLRESQDLFWRVIAWPKGVSDYLDQASTVEREQFERTFVGTPSFSNIERLEVYANDYYWRLHHVLEDQFQLVHWLLGADNFRNVATDYVLHHPSRYMDVGKFGSHFPVFLRDHDLSEQRPYLGDLARFEWQRLELIDLADDPTLGSNELRRVPLDTWESLRFVPQNTTRLMVSRWNFSQIWAAQRNQLAPQDAPLAPSAGHTLLWRRDLDVYHRQLAAPEASALTALMSGACFADICVAASTDERGAPRSANDTAAITAAYLRRWLEEGLLARTLHTTP
ncbi:MAG: DNA-binding domain-containing protein [Nannocystaceae bacterium]